MLIAAVFIVGFAVQMGGVAYICVGLQWIAKQILSSSVVDGNSSMISRPSHVFSSALDTGEALNSPETSDVDNDDNEDEEDEEQQDDDDTAYGLDHDLQVPPAAAEPFHASFMIQEAQSLPPFTTRDILYQTPAFQRDMLIGKWIHRNFDYIVFGVGFIISIPIYFSIGYAMPFHLFTSVITFLIMLHAPPALYRIILNPVLCSVAISWLVYYIFSAIRGVSFLDDLRQYKTGRTYLTLFHVPHTDKITSAPGAGDILTSLMDVAIVSLAMPIYAYRADLWRNAIVLLPTILVMTFGSFFIYPPICHIIGISPERSLAFAGRSITLALGTPFTEALGGSVPLMACTTVITAILGPLIGPFLLGARVLRIKDEDFVTRGATLGLSSGAITTAFLLRTDPRAAAMSSVCFVLYGTFMVAMASIPPLVHSLRHIVGLGN